MAANHVSWTLYNFFPKMGWKGAPKYGLLAMAYVHQKLPDMLQASGSNSKNVLAKLLQIWIWPILVFWGDKKSPNRKCQDHVYVKWEYWSMM